jgi:hypothetical protein
MIIMAWTCLGSRDMLFLNIHGVNLQRIMHRHSSITQIRHCNAQLQIVFVTAPPFTEEIDICSDSSASSFLSTLKEHCDGKREHLILDTLAQLVQDDMQADLTPLGVQAFESDNNLVTIMAETEMGREIKQAFLALAYLVFKHYFKFVFLNGCKCFAGLF